MGGLNGTPGIIKMVAFILAAVTFGLSTIIYGQIAWRLDLMVGAVFGGFFWFYLVAFVGMLTGNDIDGETSRTWAIYACVAYFGAGLKTATAYAGNTNDGTQTICLICGIVAIATSVLCFLDGFFGKG